MSEFAATQVTERSRSWYRGDCHVHSVISEGGELTPSQIVAGARAAGLNFLATTEHNTVDTHDAWSHVDDDLVVILGQEVTTHTGHWLALGIQPGQVVDWRYGARDCVVDHQLAAVHRAGGICAAAHPYAPYAGGTFMYPYPGFDVVEVWNGQWTSDVPWQADNEAALAEWGRSLASGIHSGNWRPAIGNSDTHMEGQIGLPHTVVLADELSAEAILGGIRAGRSWIAASRAVELSFRVSTRDGAAGMGERLEIADGTVGVRLDVCGVPSGMVTLHTENGTVYGAPLNGTGSGVVEWRLRAEQSLFVRAEVRDAEGRMAALTNPIILA